MDNVSDLLARSEMKVRPYFDRFEKIALHNQRKVLDAFRETGISSRHFCPTEGYGYDDIGRDALDSVFSKIFHCDNALVRPQIANGTHAIFLTLSGLLEPGDTILSASGEPYDTLDTAIGTGHGIANSLARFGISINKVPLINVNNCANFDIQNIMEQLDSNKSIKMLYVQRSRGYAWRNAICIDQMEVLFTIVKEKHPDIMIVVDNCYGLFTESKEPTDVGADIAIGSLIKNAGGGIAPTGGYIVGNEELINRISYRQTVPGAGKEIGSYAAGYRLFFQGIFLAPHTVLQALKTAVLFAEVFSSIGYETMPTASSPRSDIVQSVRIPEKNKLISFCRAVQSASPVDSNVFPEPWDMPGYEDQVIMAAGTFVQGSTSELSADGPMREPYTAYVQGSLTYEHGKIALEEMLKDF